MLNRELLPGGNNYRFEYLVVYGRSGSAAYTLYENGEQAIICPDYEITGLDPYLTGVKRTANYHDYIEYGVDRLKNGAPNKDIRVYIPTIGTYSCLISLNGNAWVPNGLRFIGTYLHYLTGYDDPTIYIYIRMEYTKRLGYTPSNKDILKIKFNCKMQTVKIVDLPWLS